MKKKSAAVNPVTVRVPDYKPALIVTMLCFAAVTVAAIVLMISIVSRTPDAKPAEDVSLAIISVLVDGHEFASFHGSAFRHTDYCDKCRRVTKPQL